MTYRPEDWPHGCHPECAYWEGVDAWRASLPDGSDSLDADGPPLLFFDGPNVPFRPDENGEDQAHPGQYL